MSTNYLTPQELTDRVTPAFLASLFPQTNPEPFLIQCIESAQERVDSRLCIRYATPASSSPLLRSLTLALAVDALWQYADTSVIPEKIKTAAADAEQLLTQIAEGTLSLPGVPRLTDSADFTPLTVLSAPSQLEQY